MTRRQPNARDNRRVLCVFVPGIKGSVLKCTACNRRSWPPEFLDSSYATLHRYVYKRSTRIEQLMNTDEIECLATHAQSACAVLRKISILNGLMERTVYASLLDSLQKDCDAVGLTRNGRHRRITLQAFAYDWTLGVSHAAEQLLSYLSEVAGQYTGIALVAHSMGGLVCRYMIEKLIYTRRSFDATSKLLYHELKLLYAIGVPHYGTVRSLHRLVDPDGGAYTKHCRKLQSLYDMIPFSDLDSQIDENKVGEAKALEPIAIKQVVEPTSGGGNCCDAPPLLPPRSKRHYTGKAERLVRYRSEIFLRKTCSAVNVDRDHWNPTRQLGLREEATTAGDHIDRLVNKLILRFPELKGCEERLSIGARTHFELNSRNKPPGCVYFCVNAVGIKSPSLIDKHNKLLRECESGDGIVCSVVERQGTGRNMWSRLNPRLFSRRASRQPSDTTRNIVSVEDRKTNKYSVHVSMLNSIDVFRTVRDVLAPQIYGNATAGLWSGKKYLWRTFVDKQTTSKVVTSTTTLYHGCDITATTLETGQFVVNVDLQCATECIRNKGLVVTVTPIERQTKNNGRHKGDCSSCQIRIRPDTDWSRVTVILYGHHSISHVDHGDGTHTRPPPLLYDHTPSSVSGYRQ